MGKVESYDVRYYQNLKPYLKWYGKTLKSMIVSSRLKRVVKGKHWQLEEYYGSGDNDFDKVVERQYKHFK